MQGYLGAIEDLQGNIEPLHPIQAPRRTRELNGEYSFSGIVMQTNDNGLAFSKLAARSVIHIGNDSYRIGKYKRSMNKGRPYVEIQDALHVFFDIYDDMQYGYLNGQINFVQALNHIFGPTKWNWINQAATPLVKVDKWGRKRSLTLLNEALDMFGVEFLIDLPTLTVTFKNKIGYDTSAQFRYNHNIKVYDEYIDDSVLVTYVEGYGANGLKRTYKSPNADRYPRLIHGDPIEDDNIKTAGDMDEQLKKLIVDDPDFEIQADILQLKEIQSDGSEINMHNYSLGDYVYCMYEPLNTDVQIRVSKIVDNPFDPDSKQNPPVLTLTNIKRNKNFTAMKANLNKINKVMKSITDADGNLSLQIKRLYRNSNHYSDNTGDWYISPDDPNAYVHIGAGGVDIHRGLLRVERENGFATIIGGAAQYDFTIKGMTPQFCSPLVTIAPRYCFTQANDAADFQAYLFRHTSRYLRINVSIYTGGAGTAYFSAEQSYEGFAGWKRWALVSTTSSNPTSGQSDKEMVIDLGQPTGDVKLIYLRMWASNGATAYGREIGIWQEK